METEINRIADEALNNPNISGYLCIDQNGLVLKANGDVDQKSSGILSSIAQLANKLDSDKSAVVCIGTDAGKILIKCKDSITTAIYQN